MPTPSDKLTKAQRLALIDAWPCPFRICRDLTCPSCGHYELGQTVHSELPELLYCRNCGRAMTEPLGWLRGRAGAVNRTPLEALAYVAVRSWNRDLPILTREQGRPLAELAARTAAAAGLGKRFAEWCAEVGPIGSKAAATRLLREVSA